MSQPWVRTGERSLLLMHIATTESVSLGERMPTVNVARRDGLYCACVRQAKLTNHTNCVVVRTA